MENTMDPAQAIRLLDAGKAVAVDVREPDEYAAGHIPDAVLLPLDRIAAQAAQALPDQDSCLLVYCRTGRRSAEGCARLRAMGYRQVADLGGILGWPYELES